jgi:hypothetical protein
MFACLPNPWLPRESKNDLFDGVQRVCKHVWPEVHYKLTPESMVYLVVSKPSNFRSKICSRACADSSRILQMAGFGQQTCQPGYRNVLPVRFSVQGTGHKADVCKMGG